MMCLSPEITSFPERFPPGQGRMRPMHQHGPKCLEGPIIGSPAWWQELGTLTEPASPPPPPRRRRKSPTKAAAPEDARGSDSVPGDPSIRAELVARIRREIAAGTYDSPEKWEVALDRLLERLDQA
jgi:hypothetical protein